MKIAGEENQNKTKPKRANKPLLQFKKNKHKNCNNSNLNTIH